MLICLGGFLGNGRKQMARRIAEKRGFHLYDVESKKITTYVRHIDGNVREKKVRPDTKELRMLLYSRILAEMPKLSKMYPDMVLEDAFPMREPREFFFNESRKYFDAVVFVWIDSDERHVIPRLERMKKKGLINNVEHALLRRQRAIQVFEPLSNNERVFKCVLGDEAESEALWALISAHAVSGARS